MEAFKFLFAGGGTGGHLFSGIAVAEEIRGKFPDSKILFVGTRYGLEKEIVPDCGFDLKFIQASPLKGSGARARLKSLLQLPKAYRQSKAILKAFSPDVVIGIGGYASGPMTLAAHFSKIPTAIIEQNSIPGFTNRHLARFVDKIFTSFSGAVNFLPRKKIIFSGNPTRKFQGSGAVQKAPDEFYLFIMGGSQGAHALNVAMMEALPYLGAVKSKLRIAHQTGLQDLEIVKQAYQAHGFSAEVFPFLQDLSPHYAKADLMICRAGAGTITELQNLGMASLLVPYPYAADDHQYHNAKEMVEAGAAELILNRELDGKKLAAKILEMLDRPELLQNMRARARSLGKPEATETVLRECLEMVRSP